MHAAAAKPGREKEETQGIGEAEPNDGRELTACCQVNHQVHTHLWAKTLNILSEREEYRTYGISISGVAQRVRYTLRRLRLTVTDWRERCVNYE